MGLRNPLLCHATSNHMFRMGRHSLFPSWVPSGLTIGAAIIQQLMAVTSFVYWYGRQYFSSQLYPCRGKHCHSSKAWSNLGQKVRGKEHSLWSERDRGGMCCPCPVFWMYSTPWPRSDERPATETRLMVIPQRLLTFCFSRNHQNCICLQNLHRPTREWTWGHGEGVGWDVTG